MHEALRQDSAEEKPEKGAHYAALTSEVRDRKEAGGHSAKLELRYFAVFKPATDNEIYCLLG